MNNKEIDIDTFGEFMDNLIKESNIQMMIDMPSGTTEPTITDNTFNAPVVQLYILLNAIGPTIKRIWETTDKDGTRMFRPDTMEVFVDGVLKMVKDDILKKAGK